MPKSSTRRRMGALASKKRENSSWSWSGPPGEHSPFPLDPFAYPGTPLLYCFLDFITGYHIMRNQINLGPQAVTTDSDQYIRDIKESYEAGFCLNEFVRVPCVNTISAVIDWGIKSPYQAILSKPEVRIPSSLEAEREQWELLVEKRIVSTRAIAFDETDLDNDLMNTIRHYSNLGGRLVSAEPVGYVRSESSNEQYGIMGVELFFNLPKHKNPTRYVYHAVTIHAKYYMVHDATQTIQQVLCNTDFNEQLKLFLNQGWKLVDICMDVTAIAEAYEMKATSKSVETIWVFEKEASRLHDHTPQWEGVIIEYLHKVTATETGDVPTRDWRPVIAGMGVSGWEIACIVQTPLLIQSSFRSFTMKLLLFFQRPVLSNFEKLKRLRAETLKSENPYTKQKQTKKGAHGVFGTDQRLSTLEAYKKTDTPSTSYTGTGSGSSSANSLVPNGYISLGTNSGTLTTVSSLTTMNTNSPPPYWEAMGNSDNMSSGPST